jgi:cell division protein FtsZ
MHEINTVAETITTAADSEANIIFGATINPELEGEIIVTVVATGFEDSYFNSPERTGARTARRRMAETGGSGQVDEDSMRDLDMELKDDASGQADDFHSEDTPNIWAISDDDTEPAENTEEDEQFETPSFFRRFRRKKGDNQAADEPAAEAADSAAEEEPIELEPDAEAESSTSDKKKK